MEKLRKIIGLVMVHFFGVTMVWATSPVSFERQDSEHIKEVMVNGNNQQGAWLYESIAALVMESEAPERQATNTRTAMELINELSSTRYNRIVSIANSELANERRTASPSGGLYWERWLEVFNRRQCEVTRGRSNGDPHIQTFDGKRFDFQTAGDYRIARSNVVTFEVQTRQVRHDERVSVNGAVVVNVNGDRVAIYAQDFPDEYTDQKMRINGEVIYNDKQVQFLNRGGVVRFQNGRYVINSPTGEQVHVRHRSFSGSDLLEIDIFVPSCGAEFEGLLGDADGDVSNDLNLTRDILANMPGTCNECVFGPERTNPDQRRRAVNKLSYIARDFGDQFIVSAEESHFERPWVDIPDYIRYPSRHLTLSDLTDEQIEEAKEQCRRSGVAEEDLMGCVFDLGYIGLTPDLPATYTGNGRVRGRALPTPRNEEITVREENNGRVVHTTNNNTTIVQPRHRRTPVYTAPSVYTTPTQRTTSGTATRNTTTHRSSTATSSSTRSSSSSSATRSSSSSGSSASSSWNRPTRTATPTRSSSSSSARTSSPSRSSSATRSSSSSSRSSARSASPSRSSSGSPSGGGSRGGGGRR